VYDYFRAVLKSGEKSERVLELTEDGLDLNPANYTVWYYRYMLTLSLEMSPQVNVGLRAFILCKSSFSLFGFNANPDIQVASVAEPKIFFSAPTPGSRKSEFRLRLRLQKSRT
jgi:hypothetical protein